jgi:hypothetical protein
MRMFAAAAAAVAGRHMGGPGDGLDITGLLTDPSSMRAPSPPISNSTSALLFSDAAAPAGDTVIKMDE